MALVWDRFPGSGSALLAMLALADFGNDQGGSIHPSVQTLARKTRLKSRYVRKVLRTLEAAGWIETVSSSAGGPSKATRHYTINIEKLSATPVPQDTPVLQDTPVPQDRDPCPTGPLPLSTRTP